MNKLLSLLAILFFATSASAQTITAANSGYGGGSGERAGAAGASLGPIIANYFLSDDEPVPTDFDVNVDPATDVIIKGNEYFISGTFTYLLDGKEVICTFSKVRVGYSMGGVPRCDNNKEQYPYYPVLFVSGDLQATNLVVNVNRYVSGWEDSVYTRLAPKIIAPGREPIPEVNIDIKK